MEAKSALRKEMLAKRNALTQKEIEEASERAFRCLFADYKFLRAESVGFYYPLKGEIDTRKMMEKAGIFGKTIYLPRILEGGICFCEFRGEAFLEKSKNGVMEPVGGEEGKPEVLIVPGLAFDLEKHRLGFGKGGYDRYLSDSSAVSIGLCYKWQVLDKLPREKHDVQMDKIIAEEWVIE
ncbi:MAG: 5-formyltetrahydrofolate cyclo-ligase [Candidatus ainarchaeum sp.]|nr:5-formyltetrahydrofolate cyclo-ligase [Candidatus ainarchaeum sp.]